jgi:hypothetical protein
VAYAEAKAMLDRLARRHTADEVSTGPATLLSILVFFIAVLVRPAAAHWNSYTILSRLNGVGLFG